MDGKLTSNVHIIGSCSGIQDGIYKCGGTNNFIKWSLDIGNENFEINSEFKVDQVVKKWKKAYFVFWSENSEYHIGLDGSSRKLYKGTWFNRNPLGKSNLKPNTFQTIVIRRIGRYAQIFLDGNTWKQFTLEGPIDAVGWRPYSNTIGIRNIVQILPKGNVKMKRKYGFLLQKILISKITICRQ